MTRVKLQAGTQSAISVARLRQEVGRPHPLFDRGEGSMFGTDYLELIAVPKGATSGRRDLLNYPFGLNGLVFGSEDSQSPTRHLARRACRSSPRSSSRVL